MGIFILFQPTKKSATVTVEYSNFGHGNHGLFQRDMYIFFWAQGTYHGPLIETRSFIVTVAP